MRIRFAVLRRWALIAALAPAALAAQASDIEMAAMARGVPVPAAFYARLAADPQAFTLPNGLFRSGVAGPARVKAVGGTRRVAVIPALFADSPEPHVAAETIQQRLFDGPAPRGTLTAAYREISGNRLTVTGEVAPWVRTDLTLAEVVGASSGLGEDARVGAFLADALGRADPDYDFGLYDNDGPDGEPNSGDDDGWVDAIAFEFIEVAASCGGPGIWPHLWGIRATNDGRPYVTDDPRPGGGFVQVDGYIVQSAVDCGGNEPQDAAVIAHEFGHVLGLPDFYHPVDPSLGSYGRRWVLGCWDLMAAGSWGCGPHDPPTDARFGPTHMSAVTKRSLDWIQYETVGAVRDREFVLRPVQESERALRIPMDEVGREFLIMEYRTRDGFDRDLPAEGLLVIHQDTAGRLRPPLEGDVPYYVTVLEQDGNRGLLRTAVQGGNRGEAGDAWGVGGATRKLHSETAPSSRLTDGGPSFVTIHGISVGGGVARVRLSTARTPALTPPPGPIEVEQVELFFERLLITGGYGPYTAEGDVPDGVVVSAEGDELLLAGSLTAPGPFEVALRVTDARGNVSPDIRVPLIGGTWKVDEDRLLQPFLRNGAESLGAAERTYLDYVGNRNGVYDVGDLRAFLRARKASGG